MSTVALFGVHSIQWGLIDGEMFFPMCFCLCLNVMPFRPCSHLVVLFVLGDFIVLRQKCEQHQDLFMAFLRPLSEVAALVSA